MRCRNYLTAQRRKRALCENSSEKNKSRGGNYEADPALVMRGLCSFFLLGRQPSSSNTMANITLLGINTPRFPLALLFIHFSIPKQIKRERERRGWVSARGNTLWIAITCQRWACQIKAAPISPPPPSARVISPLAPFFGPKYWWILTSQSFPLRSKAVLKYSWITT